MVIFDNVHNVGEMADMFSKMGLVKIRQLSREFLQEAEFTVCGEASDGRAAIEKAGTLKPDLIILDASMTVMTGISAEPRPKKLPPSTSIILFTALEFMMKG